MNLSEYLDQLDRLANKLELVVAELNELANENGPNLDFENASHAETSRCDEVQERLEAALSKLV